MSDVLARILAFLADIGIPAIEGPVPAGSFLPGIRIAGGTLIFDRAALRWPGDLLHEAGHIAVTPPALRPSLSDALDADGGDEHGGEVEALAWAYAASVHLGLDPAVVFHEGGYRGNSPGLILSFSLGVCPGSYGLSLAGMTCIGPDAPSPPYPQMARWLRE